MFIEFYLYYEMFIQLTLLNYVYPLDWMFYVNSDIIICFIKFIFCNLFNLPELFNTSNI